MSEKKRRNERIIAMWGSGCRKSEIARIFNLSTSRISQIVNEHKLIEKRAQDPMYSAFMDSAKRLGKRESVVNRAFHYLTQNGCCTLRDLCELTDDDFLKLRNVGVVSLEIISDTKAHAERSHEDGAQMFGENLETDTLMRSLRDYANYVRVNYERGCYVDAERSAKSLMQGAMELWTRMVELRREGERE